MIWKGIWGEMGVDYHAALTELQAGRIYPVYLLWGKERILRDELFYRIKKQWLGEAAGDLGVVALAGKDLAAEQIVEMADTAPFFTEKQLIAVYNWGQWRAGKQGEAADKVKPDEQRLVSYFAKIPVYSCLVFISDEKIDRRKKLYQAVEKHGTVVEFPPLKGRAVEHWLMQRAQDMGKRFAFGVAAHIINEIGTSEHVQLSMLDQELMKIVLYIGSRQTITKDDVCAVLTRTPESSVFLLVDAVGQRQMAKALQMWDDLKITGQEPLKVLYLLARQIRLIWQARQLLDLGYAVGQIAVKSGVHPFVAQRVVAQSKNFSVSQLRQCLEAIQAADWAVKSGRMDSETMMQLVVVSLCKVA